MAIIGFSRSEWAYRQSSGWATSPTSTRRPAHVLRAGREHGIIAQHCEDLKDGRAFAEVAKRVSKKARGDAEGGGAPAWARARLSHTGALAGNDKIYGDVLKQSGVIRARSLRPAGIRAAFGVAHAKGENVIIITGAGGSGVLLSDACVDNKLSLMAMPPDLDAAFRKFIPPFGAAGNPVDITGGEPPRPIRTPCGWASRTRGFTR
jgi:acyl-CoA synthetase (NDP forming)